MILVAKCDHFIELECAAKRPVTIARVEDDGRCEPVRVAIREWVQNTVVKNAEDHRGKANPESQRENGNYTETGILAQEAQRKTQITKERFQPRDASMIAVILLGLCNAT